MARSTKSAALALACATAVCVSRSLAWTVSRDRAGVRMTADPDSPDDASALMEFMASRAAEIRRGRLGQAAGTARVVRGPKDAAATTGDDEGADRAGGAGSRRALQEDDDGDAEEPTTLEIQQALLDYHNDARGATAAGNTPGQPAAVDMNRLMWDAGLAKVAQDYADGCVYDHNPDATAEFKAPAAAALTAFNSSGITAVGENIAASTGQSGTLEDLALGLATGWFDEYVDFTYATNGCGAVCGHYTQMVWAKTRYVGCGWKQCPTLTFPNDRASWTNGYFLVCNYAEAGNLQGSKPYVETSVANGACSACDADLPDCKDSMCDGCANPDFYSSACVDTYSNCADLCSSFPSECGASCNSACSGTELAAGAPQCCDDNLGRGASMCLNGANVATAEWVVVLAAAAAGAVGMARAAAVL